VWRDARAIPLPDAARPVAVISSAIAPLNISDALAQTAARHSLSPALLEALVWQESRWRSNALSPKGAVGLTQLMPATASALGVNAHDPVSNLDGGARYLRMMLDHFGGDLEKALAAYNAGPARVERANGIPQIRETQNYVAAIMARLSAQIAKP
jgi:soluble lytic murein transglycosylase-like protein